MKKDTKVSLNSRKVAFDILFYFFGKLIFFIYGLFFEIIFERSSINLRYVNCTKKYIVFNIFLYIKCFTIWYFLGKQFFQQ